MRNPAKAIFAAILVAVPAPFILAILLRAFSPEVFQILAAAGSTEAADSPAFILGSPQGIAAYVITFLIFGIAGYVAVLLANRQPAGKSAGRSNNAKPAQKKQGQPRKSAPKPAPQPQQNMDQDDDDDFDDGPEGDEEGTVKWFNVKKGFGFIVRDSGDEVFVHFRAIRGRGRRVLRQGQLVRFNVVEADKGLQADNVSILSD